MDTVTHALSGMLLGRATTSRQQKPGELTLRARLTAGFLAAAFPDIDIVARFFGVLTYIETHRGITHSFLLLPAWALLISFIFARLSRGKYQWQHFYVVSCMGIGIHILGDVITAYGTMMFAPISDTKFSWPTTFIIDFYFTGIIVSALIVGAVFRTKARHIAMAGFGILLSYIFYQGTLHTKALDIAKDYAAKHAIEQAQIFAMPQPFSPYHWKVIIQSKETYRVSYINLLGEAVITAKPAAGLFDKLDALYRPVNKLQWLQINQYGEQYSQLAKDVWSMDIMRPIRHFMMFPAVDSSQHEAGDRCIWFKDHRFVLDGVRQSPFRFGACQKSVNQWQLFRLKDGLPVSIFE